MKKYYLYTGTRQEGPFSIEELQSRNISSETKIWYNGLTNWVTASSVNELQDLFATPALPPKFPENKRKWFSVSKTLYLLGAVVLVLAAVYIFQQIEKNKQLAAEARSVRLAEETNRLEDERKKRIRENITAYVIAERSEYQYRNLGGIYGLKISVSNKTNYILDNVRVKVIYIKANGGIWKEKMLDFNLVDANTKITQRVPDEERGVHINYEIVSIRSQAIGLN